MSCERLFNSAKKGAAIAPQTNTINWRKLRIEQSMDRLSLHLKVKPGQTIVQDAIAACLDHTFKKTKKDD